MSFGTEACKKSLATLAEKNPAGIMLRAYCAFGTLAAPIISVALGVRRAFGREHPEKWQERFAISNEARPQGKLVWLNGVGLGEVLALRGLTGKMAQIDPELSFLITSMSRSSPLPIARNLPPRTIHQFLPIDCPKYVKKFLSHWRPDLAVWSEQDVWPCFVRELSGRKIPTAMVSARMNDASFEKRNKVRSLYADVYSKMDLVVAQDNTSAENLEKLGASGKVEICAPIKAACAPLADDDELREKTMRATKGRFVWLAASTHADDEQTLLDAQSKAKEKKDHPLLIIAPRKPNRAMLIQEACEKEGLKATLRTKGAPSQDDDVYIADSIGEMGAWFRMATVSFIGGTFGKVGGHNPWEAAQLGSVVLYGPNVANFKPDYLYFEKAGAAIKVESPRQIVEALCDPNLEKISAKAQRLVSRVADETEGLAQRLVDLM